MIASNLQKARHWAQSMQLSELKTARCPLTKSARILGLGLEKNVKVGGVDVIVADDDLLAGAHGARKRCGDAGLACAALAAQYDDLMHDGLPRKGC